MKAPQARIRLDFSAGCSIGPGKIALLEAVARTGSLSAAARSVGMSYRRAWLLLHSVNESFAEPSVALSVGGKAGGGAKLTPFGTRLIAAYRAFEKAVDTLAARSFADVRPAGGSVAAGAQGHRPLQRKVAAALPRVRTKR